MIVPTLTEHLPKKTPLLQKKDPLKQLLFLNQMSSASKLITKSAKTAPTLADLSTKALWKQSIAAGKAEELVAALNACPAGRSALRKIRPKPQKCFAINRASSDEGVAGGFMAYIYINDATSYFLDLIQQRDSQDGNHYIGGKDIRFEDTDTVNDYVSDCVASMDFKEARRFIKKALEIDIPRKDEDGDKVECAIDWMENNGKEGWHEQLVDKVVDFLTKTDYKDCSLPNPNVIHPKTLRDYKTFGIVLDVLAVFSINEDMFP